jgi:hypothetical protein
LRSWRGDEFDGCGRDLRPDRFAHRPEYGNVAKPTDDAVDFALVVGFARKYDGKWGTVVALMLPYVIWIAVLWTLLFIAWYLFEFLFDFRTEMDRFTLGDLGHSAARLAARS